MIDTLYQEHLEDELTRYKAAEAQDIDRIARNRAQKREQTQIKRELIQMINALFPIDSPAGARGFRSLFCGSKCIAWGQRISVDEIGDRESLPVFGLDGVNADNPISGGDR